MKKKYQLFLCEDIYDESTKSFFDKRVCEIASNSSSFSGQADNIEFYTKIDGTHTLSFNLPRYCFDEEAGEASNELVELLVDKCKIELVRKNKSFFFVMNKREDQEEKGVFSYSYSCTDAYIEELSKNGYGLIFSDELDGNGLGTIHELSEKIAKNTNWEYKKENTGTLYEYTTDLSYNIDQGRYDKIYTPVPVHPIKYIPELERYCYELEVFTKDNGNKYHRIYCYDDTEQITSNNVKNVIYNGNDFTDTVGWQSFEKNSDNEIVSGVFIDSEMIEDTSSSSYNYYMRISPSKKDVSKNEPQYSYIMNETAADANQYISAETPYALKINKESGTGSVTKILIYNKNPLLYNNFNYPDYEFGPPAGRENFKTNTYYSLKFKTSFSTPYVVFQVRTAAEGFLISDFSLFPIKGKATRDDKGNIVSAEQNNLTLIEKLSNGNPIDQKYLDIMQLPGDIIDAYTDKRTFYFIRNNYFYDNINSQEEQINSEKEDTLTYLDFKTEVRSINNYKIVNKNFVKYTANSLPALMEINDLSMADKQIGLANIYHVASDGKYYQYYELTRDGVTGGKWDYAFFGSGANDKRRTLSEEKSNRFNLIQKLAELFKVWPVFNIYRDEDGVLHKQFWFRESCIRENFSGFHKGVNLVRLSRNTVSDDVVTKMFVEDQENDVADNGFVTIRTSPLNPWGENYYYNFQYYVNQKLLNTTINKNGKTMLLIDSELEDLYTFVKGKNTIIFDLNEKIANAKVELTNLNARLISLSTSIGALNERITSLETDIKNYPLSEKDKKNAPDVKNMNTNISSFKQQRKKYEKEKENTQKIYNQIEKEWNDNIEKRDTLQKEKEERIISFEKRYSQYIKEGVWSDSSYVDNDTYFIDSQKVMNTSSMPKTDWTISVIDGSVFKELEDFEVEVGDQTILVDNEFFGIKNNYNENYVFEILISGIKDCLDKPVNNVIEVRNYLTSFEDLFQRISAATQTLELNEQTYNRAAYFTPNGQIDESILQNTLSKNSLILANARDNSYSLTSQGLFLQALDNSVKKLRVISDGIFISNSNDLNGEPQWKTGITADGMDASILTAGEIDTSLIKIFSRGQPTFSWNNLGITAYKFLNNNVNLNAFIRLDQYGLYSVDESAGINFNYDGVGQPWFNGLSRTEALNRIKQYSTFSLTDNGFRLNVPNKRGNITLGYSNDKSKYGLYIKDLEGKETVRLQNNGDNEIAGWTITAGKLSSTYSVKENSKNVNYITAIQSAKDAELVFAAGASSHSTYNDCPFRVDRKGNLYASNANISGIVNAKSGKIADWIIKTNKLQSENGEVGISSSGAYAFWAGNSTISSAPFYVTHDGRLTAKKVNISGTINAEYGNFSKNVTLNGKSLATYDDMWNLLNKADNNVIIYGNNGSIGGWEINPDKLQSNDGKITLTPDSGISLHYTDTHPYATQYRSAIGFGFHEIEVPYEIGGIGLGILTRPATATCLTFSATNPFTKGENTGKLYFTGGNLLFERGNEIFVLQMKNIKEFDFNPFL